MHIIGTVAFIFPVYRLLTSYETLPNQWYPLMCVSYVLLELLYKSE